MTVDIKGILDQLQSKALASGKFARVNMSEPKSAPGSGITMAIWLTWFGPAPADSGLAQTTMVIRFMMRLYTPMLMENPDEIDPALLDATSEMFNVMSGDFDLGGAVRNVDLLGATGVPLSGQSGYLNQDGKLMRIMDITVPLVVNDVYDQVM
jgi:hypothetical protein